MNKTIKHVFVQMFEQHCRTENCKLLFSHRNILSRLLWPSDVCRQISHTLHHMGYGSRRPVQTPLLSAVTKIKHLQFVQEHKDWTVEHWVSHVVRWITFPSCIIQMTEWEFHGNGMKAYTPHAWVQPFKLVGTVLCFPGRFGPFNSCGTVSE